MALFLVKKVWGHSLEEDEDAFLSDLSELSSASDDEAAWEENRNECEKLNKKNQNDEKNLQKSNVADF